MSTYEEALSAVREGPQSTVAKPVPNPRKKKKEAKKEEPHTSAVEPVEPPTEPKKKESEAPAEEAPKKL